MPDAALPWICKASVEIEPVERKNITACKPDTWLESRAPRVYWTSSRALGGCQQRYAFLTTTAASRSCVKAVLLPVQAAD